MELSERLRSGPPLLLDGGLGTMLIASGLPVGAPPEGWVLSQPDRIRAVHGAYAAAGADIVTTCTFGASRPRLASFGLEERAVEINHAAVRLAREGIEQAGARALIAGDMGPTGLVRLGPDGSAPSRADLCAALREQAESLAAAGADLLLVETLYDLREAEAALEAARETGLPVFVTMTFVPDGAEFVSLAGDPALPALAALRSAGAAAVGANCSLEPAALRPLVEAAVAVGEGPLIVQPNAGQPRSTPAGPVYDAEPAAFARELAALGNVGARVLGGCCGTTPTFTAAIRTCLGRDVAQGAQE